MRVLAIDTSSKVLGVAVLDEDGREVEFNHSFELRHASHLVPTIKKLLNFANLKLKDLDAYCISIGPGSFTGLRIGVSTVKALNIVYNKKIIAVPSLDVLAYNIPYTKATICVAIDAKKEKFYSCFYKYKGTVLKRLSTCKLMGLDELLKRVNKLKPAVLIGDGIEKIENREPKTQEPKKLETTSGIIFAKRQFWLPRAITTARIGLDMLKKGKVVKDADKLTPLYLHPRDVQCKK